MLTPACPVQAAVPTQILASRGWGHAKEGAPGRGEQRCTRQDCIPTTVAALSEAPKMGARQGREPISGPTAQNAVSRSSSAEAHTPRFSAPGRQAWLQPASAPSVGTSREPASSSRGAGSQTPCLPQAGLSHGRLQGPSLSACPHKRERRGWQEQKKMGRDPSCSSEFPVRRGMQAAGGWPVSGRFYTQPSFGTLPLN